jgi:cysteine-rich repeat protein
MRRATAVLLLACAALAGGRPGVASADPPPVCGDGVVEPPEDCDDGNTVDGDACPADCNVIQCGDGKVEGGEECDDGNLADGDGCSIFCTLESGPHGVGVTELTFTYHSTPFAADRTIRTRVYYPAATLVPGTTLQLIPADVPPAAGIFPVILYSHGYGAASFEDILHNAQAYYLAQHGYVVATPYHPNDSLQTFPQMVSARPQDLAMLLDQLLDPAHVPPLLRGHLDADRVGAMGQSLGGVTATATTVNGFFGSTRDPRIKAVLGTSAEDYIYSRDELATSRVPIMLLIGDVDTYFTGPTAIHDTYQLLQAPRFLVEIAGAGHSVPQDGACSLPFCHRRAWLRYPLAFFDAYLQNDRSLHTVLDAGAEAEFEGVTYFREPGPALVLGGGSRNDCMVALASPDGDGLADTSSRQLACTDGAPCDHDPRPGHCALDIELCVNVVDRRALACTPTDVASVVVSHPPHDAPLRALARAATALGATSDRRCTAPTRVPVAIPRGRRFGRRTVRVRAADAAGRHDEDAYLLTCIRP